MTTLERDVLEASAGSTPRRRSRSARVATAELVPALERGTSRKHGWIRQPSDGRLLEFATLHGAVSVRQATKYFYGGNAKTAEHRVRVLVEAGLLERNADAGWAGVVLYPTLDGQTVGLRSTTHPLRKQLAMPKNLEHKLAVGEQALVSMSRGMHVVLEREIRMFEARPEAEVHAYLARHGAVASRDGVEAGIVPSVLTMVRELPDERGGGFKVLGERKTWLGLPVRSSVDDMLDPFGEQRSQLRYPDFIEITKSGELTAVEVEISNKADARLRAIVEAYRDALAYVEVGPPGEDGKPQQRLRRRQFRRCRWVCSPEVLAELQGVYDFTTQSHALGLVQEAMPKVYPPTFDWNSQDERRPVQVLPIVAEDVGLQYALDQRNLEHQYQCGYRQWKAWRKLWESDIEATKRPFFTFTRWLRASGNLKRCKAAAK